MTTRDGQQPLPTGTVAFLMTDIEGSTQLVGRLGDAWPSLLDTHFALLREVVTAHGGTWISSEGDSVFAVFPSVRQAIAAAVQAQRATATGEAAQGQALKVRMGIHAGEAVLGGRDTPESTSIAPRASLPPATAVRFSYPRRRGR